MRIAFILHEESLQFDQCFRPFSVILQPLKFYKVEFTYTSSAVKTVRKISKFLRSVGF